MNHCKWFDYEQLTKESLEAILELRQRIFVIEQQSIYPDIDGLDKSALHLVMQADDGEMIGYVRLRELAAKHCWKIERVLLLQEYRGTGIGQNLIEESMRKARELHPQHNMKLSSQCNATDFYKRFGFSEKGAVYDDGGIDHIDMMLF
jgi:ElaA protein